MQPASALPRDVNRLRHLDTSAQGPLAGTMSELLSAADVEARLHQLPGWSSAETGDRALTRTFKFDDFRAALSFVNRVGDIAEQLDHHPDVDIRWNKVTLTLSTHSAGGLTERDFTLAHRIDDRASEPSG
jgi:4a-hydroxytetrahydrobiopterin dehydratase